MMGSHVKTFIFVDLEATGLRKTCPKITEVCMIAVHASSIRNPERDASGKLQLPRVLDKLCLCVTPDKPLSETASELTGLSKELLARCEKPLFDLNLFNAINAFINRQAQPVCLVAHNGFFYDFPLLKAEFRLLRQNFPNSMLCFDTLQAFRHLSTLKGENEKRQNALENLYLRFFGREASFAHSAEGDALSLIMVFIHKAVELMPLATFKRWGAIQSMY